jgi:hypothetical protein
MKKADLRPQEPKQALKWEVKTLVPWIIILVLAALATGAMLGWTARSNQVSEIKAEVATQLAETQSVKK